jgi:hypothetical protein
MLVAERSRRRREVLLESADPDAQPGEAAAAGITVSGPPHCPLLAWHIPILILCSSFISVMHLSRSRSSRFRAALNQTATGGPARSLTPPAAFLAIEHCALLSTFLCELDEAGSCRSTVAPQWNKGPSVADPPPAGHWPQRSDPTSWPPLPHSSLRHRGRCHYFRLPLPRAFVLPVSRQRQQSRRPLAAPAALN